MPCYDERNSAVYINNHEVEPLRKKVKKLEAMLCAVLSVNIYTGDSLISLINEKESGITRKELRQWWIHHKEEDRIRKQREKELKERHRKEQEGYLLDLASTLGYEVRKK